MRSSGKSHGTSSSKDSVFPTCAVLTETEWNRHTCFLIPGVNCGFDHLGFLEWTEGGIYHGIFSQHIKITDNHPNFNQKTT